MKINDLQILPPDASGLLAKHQPRFIWVLADFRHPDVTLESGLPHTIGDLAYVVN